MYFEGAMTALVTPWTADGSAIDYDNLSELIERQINAGIKAIVPAGTTGESATLTHNEQQELVKFVVEKVAGRILVIAGAGSNSTAEAVNLAKWANEVGADGILSITPYYNRPTPRGLLRHFAEIAKAAKLPIMIYHVPKRTGLEMTAATIANIFTEIDEVVAIKEASGSIDLCSDIRATSAIELISGDDAMTLPMMALGARGVVSVVSNVVPEGMVELVQLCLQNNFAAAQTKHFHLLKIMRAMFIETNPTPAKTALKMMGISNGVLRLPMCELSPDLEEKFRSTLVASGLNLK